ncbi:phosphatase PAP2 family protein [Vibrio sp. TRT 21S02]|uniref:phosphatase PAP2 family protein n=1 Tax=unclassified Vibrio TaxID=2614977 RepID=UPI00349F192B
MNTLINNKRHGLILLGCFLTLIGPLALTVSHIDLLDPVSDSTGFLFTLLTDSAGSKGFLLTLVVLCTLCLRLNLTKREILSKLLQLGVILVLCFASKTGLKMATESPRPYTQLLVNQLLIPQASHFYNLSSDQQNEVIQTVSTKVSPWRTHHWLGETDYSFPSGHTIFASICVAFFAGLFLQHKRYASAGVILLWALGVAYSRLWLGMHRPVDLVGSAMFVALVYALVPEFNLLADRVMQKLPKNWLHGL